MNSYTSKELSADYIKRCKEFKTRIDCTIKNIYRSCNIGIDEMTIQDMLSIIYVNLFDKVPQRIEAYHYDSFMKERNVDDLKPISVSEDVDDDWCDKIITENTFINILKYYQENNIAYFLWRYDTNPIIIAENEDIVFSNPYFEVYCQCDEFPKYIMDSIVIQKDKTTTYYYLSYGKHGFETIDLNIKEFDVDINTNYNDDLPYEQIVNTLNSDEAGLIIFRGEPGTAKSTLIKHFITNIDKDFIYLDPSCFDSMTDSSFIQLLSDYEDSVLILEDCENIVKSRDGDINNKLAPLLNLTSGLLADSFKFKVICTFNAPITQIDKALLRKGRLKIDYEFKKLTPTKTANLAQKLSKEIKPGSSMNVGDIYNSDSVVRFGHEKKDKIGLI